MPDHPTHQDMFVENSINEDTCNLLDLIDVGIYESGV